MVSSSSESFVRQEGKLYTSTWRMFMFYRFMLKNERWNVSTGYVTFSFQARFADTKKKKSAQGCQTVLMSCSCLCSPN